MFGSKLVLEFLNETACIQLFLFSSRQKWPIIQIFNQLPKQRRHYWAIVVQCTLCTVYTTYTCRKLSVRGCEMISDGGIEAVARHCTRLMQLNIQVHNTYTVLYSHYHRITANYWPLGVEWIFFLLLEQVK